MLTKVLVIDDDPDMTDLLSLLLKASGFEVLVCNYGEKGIQLTHDFSPNVIILDLMMIGMDGWQVCAAIREFSSIPILILTALDNPEIIVSALDAGADDFLTKPVSSSLLVSRLKTLTRRMHTNDSGIFVPAPPISI
ncbi:MAG: response regulator [Chloroflexota bacterium]